MPEPVFTRTELRWREDCTVFDVKDWQRTRALNPTLISRNGRYLWAKTTSGFPPRTTVTVCYVRFNDLLGEFDISDQSCRDAPLNTPPWANCVVWLGDRYPNINPN